MTKIDSATERKALIIHATIECIAQYGYTNFSMQDVAKVAGVSKGIIHYYFMNKEELMMSVLNRVSSDIEQLLSNLLETIKNPEQCLRSVLHLCFGVVRKKREYYCINMDFWTQINQKEKVRQSIAQHYEKFRSVTAHVIQLGIDKQVFKVDNAKLAASVIIALIDGIALQWLFDETVFVYEDMVKKCEEIILEHLLGVKS